MDKQEALDKNWKWFVVQGNPQGLGIDPTMPEAGLVCMYRGVGGCRCAAGTLIPDDRYHSDMEGKAFSHNLVTPFALEDLFPESVISFIESMQDIHDRYGTADHGDFTTYMERGLRSIAKEHDLTIPSAR